MLDAYATLAVTDQVSVLVHADGGVESNELGSSGWLAGAIYGRVQLSSKLYAAARGDYFREWVAEEGGVRASPIFWPTEWIASVTATVAYQPVDGISVRMELRHDHADSRAFFGGDVVGDGTSIPFEPNRRAQDTVTVGATAWF